MARLGRSYTNWPVTKPAVVTTTPSAAIANAYWGIRNKW